MLGLSVMSGVNMLCWAGVTYSLVILDPFSLLGIKPLVEKLLRRYNYNKEVEVAGSLIYV